MTTYLIIGNGIAANTAAENIRKNDQNGAIIMFTREKYFFYYLPALPEYLAGEKQLQNITLHNEAWYKQNNITLNRETDIIAIDPQKKTATAKDGRTFAYDKLLLATGGYSFMPPIKGVPADGVFSLRTLDDANAIKERAQRAKKLVLIGGGLVGLEAGNGLRKLGIEVCVVEFMARLLPRQMDTEGAALLRKQMEKMGFSFYLGAKTRDIVREGSGLAVNLEGGEKIAADMVLVSAGVRPEVTLAKSLGLEIDKGVKVDDTMKTGIDDIYAAGDLIEHSGRFYGVWPASMEQGRTAGLSMAGKEAKYEGTVLANSLKVVGIDLVAAGEIDAEGKYEAIVKKDAAGTMYRKIVLQDNKIIGSILFGNIAGSDAIQLAIKTKKDVSACKQGIADETFDFNRLK
jgi:nitrite reductase (NADH) large subunit